MNQRKVKPLRLQTYRNEETIEILSHLFEEAMEGNIKGMLFSVKYNQDLHKLGVTGEYRDDPCSGIRPHGKIGELLDKYADEREEEAEIEIEY